MPLIRGSSQKVISKNIKKELRRGKSHEQAVAIAMAFSRKTKKKKN